MARYLAGLAKAGVLCCCLLGTPAAGAQEKAATPQQIAVKAQHVLDVRSGTMLTDAMVLVEEGLIKAVGEKLAIGPDVKVIDLGTATLLPGLIDAHTHLLATFSGEYADMILTKSQAYRALEGAANARRTLHAGFTTVRDVENEGSGYADVALRDAIARGLVEGPRMLVATRGIAVVGQYNPFGISPDLPDFPRGAQMVSGVEECRRAVREQIGNGADLIKVYADWQYPTLTAEELGVIVEEAHKAGRRVAVHATTVKAIQNAVDAGADSIEHGWGADRATLERMKEKGVTLVPTLGAVVNGVNAEADEASRQRGREFLGGLQKMVQDGEASRREDRQRIRCDGRDPPWHQRPGDRRPARCRAVQPGSAARRHADGRGAAEAAGQDRLVGAREVCRHDRGRRRSAGRRQGPRAGRLRDEGRSRGARCRRIAVSRPALGPSAPSAAAGAP
jgi:imidazolonepropionase-like amidohydrolase